MNLPVAKAIFTAYNAAVVYVECLIILSKTMKKQHHDIIPDDTEALKLAFSGLEDSYHSLALILEHQIKTGKY